MWGADLTALPRSFPVRPVWVDLDVLYGPAPSPAGLREGGVVLTGRVPGRLLDWKRARDGRWVGIVDFALCDAAGQIKVHQEQVAVPAAALTPMPVEPRR